MFNPLDAVADVATAIADAAGSVADAVEESVIDPIADVGQDLAEWIDANVLDRVGDGIQAFGQLVEQAVAQGQDAFTQFIDGAKNVWSEIGAALDGLWHGMTAGMSEAWNWLKDATASAVDWLQSSADAVLKWVVEDAIPYLADVLEFAIAVVVALGALLLLPLCALLHGITHDDEAVVLRGIAENDAKVTNAFKVERRSSRQKYVVFSDVHMFGAHDLDFFNRNHNAAIYRHALRHYAAQNYVLIENGDVEDFWMRDNQALGAINAISDNLPWPYFAEPFREQGIRSQMQSHALSVFLNNADTYALIRQQYYDRGRYVRTLGNHDDAWRDAEVAPFIDLIYPKITVNDYCTLDGASGQADVVLAHGHQSDVFNMPMCAWAGKALTNVAARLYELSFGELNAFYRPKEEWMAELAGRGFKNELLEMNIIKGISFDEAGLYEDVESIYGSSRQPTLVLSHTHNVRDEAGVPQPMFKDEWTWKEYANSGTVGMWEGIVTGLEISYPSVKAVAWLHGSRGAMVRRELQSFQYGDVYLRAV